MSSAMFVKQWKRLGLACALALVGCETGSGLEPPLVEPEGCSADDPAEVYRLAALHVPTHADVEAGVAVGHDLDGIDDACDQPDYEGGVDNMLVDLASALNMLAPNEPFVLQEIMDDALFCTDADPSCTPQWVGLRVQECQRGVKVDVFRRVGDTSTPLGTSARAELGSHGELRAEFAALALDDAFEDPHGAHTLFALVNVRLTATVTEDGLVDGVLGGVLPAMVFDVVIPNISPSAPEFQPTEPVLAISDIALEPGGACDGLSMGLTFSAGREPAPAPLPLTTR